jgi:hypothetical protein
MYIDCSYHMFSPLSYAGFETSSRTRGRCNDHCAKHAGETRYVTNLYEEAFRWTMIAGAYPTTLSYNASVVKIYSATT